MEIIVAYVEQIFSGDIQGALLVIVYLFTVLLFFAVATWMLGGRDPVQRRLKEIAEGHTQKDLEPHAEGMFQVKWVKPISEIILPKDEWKRSNISRKLVLAGYRSEMSVRYYLLAKFMLAIILPLLVALPLILLGVIPLTERVTAVIVILVAAFIGYYMPDMFLRQKRKERELEFNEGFPDAMDMLVVCVEAGLGLDAAIQRVGREIAASHPELAKEIGTVSLELRAGKTRNEALRALGERTNVEQVKSLASVLIQAEHFGTSIASALREHASEMRLIRIQTAKERAAKLPVKLLFPIIFFIFPALFLIVLGPAVVRIITFFMGADI